MREQRATTRRATTVVGAPVGDGRARVTPVVLGVLVVVFVLQLAVPRLTGDLAFAPVVSRAEPWRFLTAGLVHSTGFPAHLLLNGLVLWSVGREAEVMLGRWRYLGVLVLAVIGGSVAVLWFTPVGGVGSSWTGATVGASGGIFGLFGAAVALERRAGRPVGRQLLVVVGLALIGIVLPSISWQGHVGGLVTGLAAGAVLTLAPRERRTTWQVGGLVAILAVLVALVVVRWATVPGGALI